MFALTRALATGLGLIGLTVAVSVILMFGALFGWLIYEMARGWFGTTGRLVLLAMVLFGAFLVVVFRDAYHNPELWQDPDSDTKKDGGN